MYRQIGRISWGWLKYTEIGIDPLVCVVSNLFWLTILIAGVLYFASKASLYIKRDPDFQRREALKSKVKNMIFFVTPLILLPLVMGNFFWEHRYFKQAWVAKSGIPSDGFGYPGLFINRTYGSEFFDNVTTLVNSGHANWTYESTDLSRMIYTKAVVIPAMEKAARDIVAICVPLLTLIALGAAIVGLVRWVMGRGEAKFDERTIA